MVDLGRRKSNTELIAQLEQTQKELNSFAEKIHEDYQLGKWQLCEYPDKFNGRYESFYSYPETDIGQYELYDKLEYMMEALDKKIDYLKEQEAAA